jgi:hypothetical protein
VICSNKANGTGAGKFSMIAIDRIISFALKLLTNAQFADRRRGVAIFAPELLRMFESMVGGTWQLWIVA